MNMEPIDWASFNFDTPDNITLTWESQDPINGTNTIAFDAREQSDTEMQTAPATNIVNPISIDEPASTILPRQSGVEPDKPKRISRAEWEMHRNVIEAQHPIKTLTELREYMVTEHGFVASTQQWKKKLLEWRLSKNLRPRVTKFIRKRTYGRRVREKKATQYRLRGQPIPMDKVKRHLQELPDNPSSPTGSTPTGISYDTYRSPIHVPTRPDPPLNLSPAQQQEIYQRSTTPVSSPGTSELGPIIPAFWKGHDIDHYLAVAQTAISHEKGGGYVKAKPAFIEALEGLGILLSPVHARTISALENFTNAARRNGDMPAALDKLHSSHLAHGNLLGPRDKRTWRSLARLGLAYQDAGNVNQAYHMLLNARQGLLDNMSESNQEDLFLSTMDVSRSIAEVLRQQRDYDEAQKEFSSLISQAESLGEGYQGYLRLFKYKLAQAYLDHVQYQLNTNGAIIFSDISFQRSEHLLQELIQRDDASEKANWYSIGLEKLVWLYQSSGQKTKFQELLPLVQKALADTLHLDIFSLKCTFMLQRQVSITLTVFGKYDEAEAWFMRLQSEIESSPLGSRSTYALVVYLDHCRCYFKQGKREIATEILKEMQVVAGEILPQDHEFHSLLEVAIKDGIFEEPCPVCLRSLESHMDGLSCSIM